MKINVASQTIGAEMITAADGSAFTGAVTVYVTGDGGTQAIGSVGSGACTHEGNGFHTYVPAQAETNYAHVAFTFIGTGAVPATVQVYTNFPQTVDNATNITAIKTKTDFLPSVTAGSSGGVFIAGTNAATTITTGLTTTFTGNLTGSVGSVTGAVGSVTGAVGSVTGNVGGNVVGSVGSVTTVNDKTGYALSAAGVDGIWDEPIVGHLTAGTVGLSEALGSSALVDTTVTGTPTSTTVELTAGSAIDDFYNDQLIYVLSGTGIGQVRTVSDYTGSTKTVAVDEAWIVTPAASDRVAILVSHVHPKTQISAQVMADLDANGSTVIDELTTQGDTNETKLDTLTTNVAAVPTAVENRQEMDSNSTQLNTTLPALIDDLAIKKNTAFPNFEFLMVLTSDGRTPATGLTVTGQRSIDGAAFASVSGTIAEVSNGIYQFDALAADTNGDVITWRFSSATADDAFITFKTVA